MVSAVPLSSAISALDFCDSLSFAGDAPKILTAVTDSTARTAAHNRNPNGFFIKPSRIVGPRRGGISGPMERTAAGSGLARNVERWRRVARLPGRFLRLLYRWSG